MNTQTYIFKLKNIFRLIIIYEILVNKNTKTLVQVSVIQSGRGIRGNMRLCEGKEKSDSDNDSPMTMLILFKRFVQSLYN